MPRDCGAGDWACTPHPQPRWEGCIASILCVSSGAPTHSCDLYLQLCKLTAWYLGHLRSLYFWELNLSLSLPCSYKFNFEKAGEKKKSLAVWGIHVVGCPARGASRLGADPRNFLKLPAARLPPCLPGIFRAHWGGGRISHSVTVNRLLALLVLACVCVCVFVCERGCNTVF